MHTVYHVAAVHEATNRWLAAVTPAGWVLPTLVAREDVPMARLFALAVGHVAIRAAPRCLARPEVDPLAGSANITIVIDIDSDSLLTAESAALIAGGDLIAGTPMLAYQADTVRWLTAQAQQAARPAPLGPGWIRDVAAWVADVAGFETARVLTTAQILRADEESAVVQFCPAGERLYFKGRTRPPFVEALAGRLLAAHAPGLVAPIRAFDSARGWQLTAHVDGVPLEASCWPAHLMAADDWRRLQQALEPFETELVAMGVPRLTPALLRAAVVDALEAVSGDLPPHLSIGRALERVDTLLAGPLVVETPPLLLHFDAAPRNILWNGQRAVFLDLDSLHVGSGLVAGELMSRRMKGVLAPDQRQQLTRHATRSLLRAIGRSELEPLLAVVPALTDLCLLAMRRSALWPADRSSVDLRARAYTWRRNAQDFVARLAGWPTRVHFPHRWST
jgi:hypothetical protein